MGEVTDRSSGEFADVVAVVTGGGSGIGRAIAHGFAAAGASVAVVGRRPGPLDATIAAHRDRMLAVVGDVGAPGAAANVIEAIVARFGRIDVLVNNAAVFETRRAERETDESIVAAMMTNQFGPLALSRDAVPHLRATKGCIVNISSLGARLALPGNSVYAGTKAALEHMTRILAVELGRDGIRVNAVAPGPTTTDKSAPTISEEREQAIIRQTPLGRMGTTDDIVPVVLFLASDGARWITGQTIQATGGLMT